MRGKVARKREGRSPLVCVCVWVGGCVCFSRFLRPVSSEMLQEGRGECVLLTERGVVKHFRVH